jgi:hypothetical protein
VVLDAFTAETTACANAFQTVTDFRNSRIQLEMDCSALRQALCTSLYTNPAPKSGLTDRATSPVSPLAVRSGELAMVSVQLRSGLVPAHFFANPKPRELSRARPSSEWRRDIGEGRGAAPRASRIGPPPRTTGPPAFALHLPHHPRSTSRAAATAPIWDVAPCSQHPVPG